MGRSNPDFGDFSERDLEKDLEQMRREGLITLVADPKTCELVAELTDAGRKDGERMLREEKL